MAPQAVLKLDIPKYSKKEEKFNSVSHLCGFCLGLLILMIFLFFGLKKNLDVFGIISLGIYAMSMMILYLSSCIYHSLDNNKISKKVLRIVDHCTIFILIAGTYTPICVLSFGLKSYGLAILITEWVGTILGIIMNICNLKNLFVRIFSVIIYLVLGWLIIIFPGFFELLKEKEFIFIFLGGVVYSLGVIFYTTGKNKKWFHSIFHIFCVAATLLQAIGIFYIVIR